jgi:hypothetical protein
MLMKNVPFTDRRPSMPHIIEQRYNQVIDGDKLLPCCLPPLLVDECKKTSEDAIYDMGITRGGSVKASLHLKGVSGSTFDIEIPLVLLPYVTCDDPSDVFNQKCCAEIDKRNYAIIEHNKYITSLLSLFTKAHDCGTSAGQITLPPTPDSMVLSREKKIKSTLSDKYMSMMLAITYLAKRDRYAIKDYNLDGIIDLANEIAFREEIDRKIREGGSKGVKFRIVGSGVAPTYWSGIDGEPDQLNRKVKWEKGSNHSFINPHATVVLVSESLIPQKK